MVNPEQLAELQAANDRAGVRAALEKLNSLTEHRFTALYIFAGEINKNLFFYDRQNPTVESAGDFDDLPVTVTYCVYVRRHGAPFTVEDSLHDDRVTDHPAKNTVRAYCGVPLLDQYGNSFATLCHFDFEPIPDREEHIELMQSLALILQKHVRKSH
jgi:GAF domain-containing protein